MKILNPYRFYKGAESTINTDVVKQAELLASNEIVLPDSENGKDRFLTVEKVSPETISPLVKKDVSIDGIYEVIDRNFSYPFAAHVGLKFDSRTFSNIPERQFDVKMKKVKVPSNYFPLGGNGLDRRYVFSNPDYPANPNTLDLVFVIDQNLDTPARALIKRNLRELVFKVISGYTNVRYSIWQAVQPASSSGVDTVVNKATQETIVGFTYYESNLFKEVETPDSVGNNQTNLFKSLEDALNQNKLSPTTNPAETSIANFFLRKNQFSITDEVGKLSEDTVLDTLWTNTVRKVIYFSGSTPETMSIETYRTLLNRAREGGIQFYYLYTSSNLSGTRTLRELAEESGGAKFNLLFDSDYKLQEFFDKNFYDSNKIYYGNWDGTFKLAWTDNPAWILYDIITDFNYGLGNHIDSSSVDKWTLYEIGRYCDAVDDDGKFRGVPDGKGGLEPRYTCNIIFYNKDEAYNVLKDIAAIFKGIIYWNTEGFSFFADKKKNPLIYFANANVKDGAFNYTETAKNKRYTSVEITYNDKYDNYKTKIEFVEDVDGIRNFGLNPFKVNAAGCTSRSEARRIGRYILTSSMFESDTVTFTAGLEGAYLQPGDIFGISDEVRNAGRSFGRILEVNEASNTIKIDGEFVNGLASGIYMHVPSGNFSVSDLTNLTGSNGAFTGTLEQIRDRRQKQTRKFNIHTVTDDPYGATLTVTGDFLLQSVIHDVYVNQTRTTGSVPSYGAGYTGFTTLTGNIYTFPSHTIAEGNPKWDTLTSGAVNKILSDLEIDIDIFGQAGTGQLIVNETPSWILNIVAFYNTSQGSKDFTYSVEGGSSFQTNTFATIVRYNNQGAIQTYGSVTYDVNSIWSSSVYTDANIGDLIIAMWPAGTDNTAPNSTWSSFGATEVFKLGADTNAAKNTCMYCVALIKGGYRLVEAVGKRSNEFPSLKLNYRDMLAFTKLRPFYTFVQADFGNRAESNYENWESGREYAVGNIVKYNSETYICTKAHTKSASTFTNDFIDGNTVQSKWSKGNSLGYYTVGLPKNFYGSEKVYLDQSLTSTHVYNAFQSLGINVVVGVGTLGQSDLRTLQEINGIGYSGLVYGTGYPKGYYNLTVDTTPKNLDLINEGSLYVLSGSGVEPKLYKTIATKEEEANQYSIVGMEYLPSKEEYIEKDILDTSPSYYVKGPYDVVIKPNPPAGLQSISGYGSPNATGIHVTWLASDSPVAGYKIYVSRPDYSTLTNEKDSIVESYSTVAPTTTLTVPITGIYGQYDFDIYAQSNLYKLLSMDSVKTTFFALPTATLTGAGGYTITSTMPSGLTIDTADKNSVNYQIAHLGGGLYAGAGAGNFTSKDVTFRWKYIDPTGGIMSSREQIYENPFLDLPQNVTVQVLDIAGQVVYEEKNYQGLSYTVTSEMNARLFDDATTPETVDYSRNIGLRVIVTDNTSLSKTGTFYAYNQPPAYSRIQVIDSYQNSPYYILSGYYGHRTFTGLAVWSPDVASTIGAITTISGSGVRDANGNLIRSENDEIPLTFRDISGAFPNATFYNGTGLASLATTAVGINYKGSGEPDYEKYVYEGGTIDKYGYISTDLIDYYNEKVDKSISIQTWGYDHYTGFGSAEGRVIPRTLGNPLGIANLYDITAANTTGFSGISLTVLTEEVSKNQIIFNCYNATSNKDVYSVDIYTGDNPSFQADILKNTNLFNEIKFLETRSYLNTIKIGQGLETGIWYYFKLVPWDVFGPGIESAVVSGYLESEPTERVTPIARKFALDGGRNQDEIISIKEGLAVTPLIKGYRYIIQELGNAQINWIQIGAEAATIGTEFEYNGAAISGGLTTVGKVKRAETKYLMPESQLNDINLVTPNTDSSIVLPADMAEGNAVTIVNKGKRHNIYILDANGNEISIIRPNERAEIFRDDTKWLDSRGSILSLE